MMASMDSVYRAQQTFSDAKVTACRENRLSQGVKLPVVFADSEHSALEDCDPKTTDERTPQDILITGKPSPFPHGAEYPCDANYL